tara:strand:- start:2324 stop:3082 length:759 start_codon:yes stop_codon:yes gene_type:complete
MIRICTVYFEGKYTPDYVEKLYNSLKRNCTLPFEFICYSDNPNVKADKVIPLPNPKYTDIKKHWHKITFFSPMFAGQEPGDDMIIMDIDQVIVGNVDHIIGRPVGENELLSYKKWWGFTSDWLPLNGGFYKFKSGGKCKNLWDKFRENPEYWQLKYFKSMVVHYKYFGEQNFVYNRLKEFDIKLLTVPGQHVCKITSDKRQNMEVSLEYMKKYNTDYMILDKPHPNIRIVHFANPHTTIHESGFDWIKDYWK